MNAAQKKSARLAAEASEKPKVTTSQKQVPQTQTETAKSAADVIPHASTEVKEFMTSPLPANIHGDAAADAATDALAGKVPLHMRRQAVDEDELFEDPRARSSRMKRIQDLQEEILLQELETKKILHEQALENNQQYKQTKEQRLHAAKQAQKILNSAAWTQRQIEAGCPHKTGGFGMEDMYNGKKEPSIVSMELPVAGRKAVLCYRCLKLVVTPDPNLRLTNMELFLEQTADYTEFLKLERDSLSKPMAAPNFTFEQDGRPVHPVIV